MKKSVQLFSRSLPFYVVKYFLIMKLAIVIILFTAMHAQAKLYGQNINMRIEKTEVKKILSQIEKSANVRFLYNYELTPLMKKKVDFVAENISLSQALSNLLNQVGLNYKVLNGNLIVILSAAQSDFQNIEITGKVTNENNTPLSGVSVQVKGTNIGVLTNDDGNFTIAVPDRNAVLVFSYVGYQEQEVPVGNQTTLNIILQPASGELEQVVVVGYGAQKKQDITGAVSVVNAEDFSNRPIVNAAAALQGQSAGVNVFSPSGKPGSGLAVSIRGNTSLSAANDPIYVVDGVILRNIDFLNPQDIESFSILKDASSAAIYGSSGANGVVLITTKKGITGKNKISVSAYTGFSNFSKKIDVLNKTQYLDLMNELGYTDNGTANTNWQDEAFNTGHDNSVQLAVSGGNEKSHYYTSLNYQKQEGVVDPAEYDRYSARVNLDIKPRDWFTISSNLNFSRSKYIDVPDNAGVARGGVILSALTTPPTIGIYNSDGTFTSNPNKSGWENPIAYAFGPDQKSIENRFVGNVAADVKLINGLTFRSNLGAENQDNRWDYFLDPYRTDYGRSKQGYGQVSTTSRFVWLWENTLNYIRHFGDHDLNVLAGHTMQESDYRYSYDAASHYANAAVPTLNAASLKEVQISTRSQWSKRSYLARVNYGYKNKYLLTSNVRYDGSSRFQENNRFGWFPSVSAAWRISEENFMANSKIFSDLKLRAGWGKTGNDEIGSDYNYALFNPTGTGGFQFQNLDKPDLSWESTEQTNVGLDMGFLKNRLLVTIDAYYKKTTDLLVSVQPPPSSGFGAQYYNVGSMENKGIEATVIAHVIDKAFQWNINANFSLNRNKVLSLGAYTKNLYFGDIYERGSAIRIEPGRSLGSIFGYQFEGVDPQTGNAVYTDLDKDGTITANDRTFIGNAQPDFIYGMTNTMGYKNFELSFFIQGSQGNDIFNASRIELESMNDSKNQSIAVLNRWKTAGQITDIPKAVKSNTDNTQISSRFVENGSYLRMKAITLSYNFQNAFFTRVGITRCSIYATAQNLFTITDYKGFDPEVSQYGGNGPAIGIDYGTYPPSRSFIFGLNVDF